MADESTMESGLVAKEAADEQRHPIWSATKDFLRPLNPITGAMNAIDQTIHPAPTDTPGENVIDKAATGLWHAAGRTLDRADRFSKAAQHSKTFGEWAGNTSQGLGNILATAVPGIGPAAAHAGETTGGNATDFLSGNDKKFIAPKPIKGLAEGGGLIAGTLLGGTKGRIFNKYVSPVLNKPLGQLFEGGLEEPAPTILPPGHAGEEAAQVATATAKPEVFNKFMGDWATRNAASNNAARLRAAHPPAIEAPYSDQLPADEISPLADWSKETSQKGAIPGDKPVDKYPVSLKYDEDGNITDLDGRHRVIQAIEDGQATIPVHTKMRDGTTSILHVDPKRVAQQFGVTKESLAATDAQNPTRAGDLKPNKMQSIDDLSPSTTMNSSLWEKAKNAAGFGHDEDLQSAFDNVRDKINEANGFTRPIEGPDTFWGTKYGLSNEQQDRWMDLGQKEANGKLSMVEAAEYRDLTNKYKQASKAYAAENTRPYTPPDAEFWRKGGGPMNITPKDMDAAATHEAGHAVLGHNAGLKIHGVAMHPDPSINAGAYVKFDDASWEQLDPKDQATILFGGKAAEQRMKLEQPGSEAGDMNQAGMTAYKAAKAKGLEGPDVALYGKKILRIGEQRATDLLNGELAQKHTALSGFFREHYGEDLTFEQFSHLLQALPVAVGAGAAAKLYKNYQDTGKGS